jgi:hypothetical protein
MNSGDNKEEEKMDQKDKRGLFYWLGRAYIKSPPVFLAVVIFLVGGAYIYNSYSTAREYERLKLETERLEIQRKADEIERLKAEKKKEEEDRIADQAKKEQEERAAAEKLARDEREAFENAEKKKREEMEQLAEYQAHQNDAEWLDKKFGMAAMVSCNSRADDYLRSISKYAFKWDEKTGWIDTRFDRIVLKTKAPGLLTLASNSASLQNGFGAYQRIKLTCDYDTSKKAVVGYSASEM